MLERRPSARWVALAAALALVCPGCSAFERAPEQLTIGIVDVPAVGLVHLARNSGFFDRERLQVRYVSFPTGRDALTAMMEGRVDVATSFGTPVVARALGGDKPRVLTTLHQSSRNTRVVVPKGRGIERPEDLRGRRVGVPRGTSAEFFLETLAALSGVEPLEVGEVDMRPQDAGSLLLRGQVDAVAIWYPWVQCGHPPVEALECIELFSDGYIELSILVTRDDVISSRREALKRLMRGLARAEQLVLERPDAVVSALAAELPERGGAHLADAWRRVTPQLGLDNLLLTVLDREAHWLQQRMDEPTPFVDFRTLFYPDLLLEIDPSAVTLLTEG